MLAISASSLVRAPGIPGTSRAALAGVIRLVIAALLSCSAIAHAATPQRYRFHLLNDKLVSKLSPGARRNEQAVVAFPRASGFVVASDPKNAQRLLVLTNYHVAGDGPPNGRITFRDGTVAMPVRTVNANKGLDYALVEVQLVSGPRKGGVAPLLLERSERPMRASERIYAIGGHTGLNRFKQPSDSIAGGRDTILALKQRLRSAPKGAKVGFRTIGVGRVSKYARVKTIMASKNATRGISADLPNAGGMSGSPIFSSATHRVVGLHFSGLGPAAWDWIQSSVPIDLILHDLREALRQRKVDESARDLVHELVSN